MRTCNKCGKKKRDSKFKNQKKPAKNVSFVLSIGCSDSLRTKTN